MEIPKTHVRKALNEAGRFISMNKLAKELGISYQAIDGWKVRNTMPDTEYSGKTAYSKRIEEITEGAVKVSDLLWFVPPHQQ